MNDQDVTNLQAEADGFPKYPEVSVQLSGEDGNVYAILGRVLTALRRAGVNDADRAAFHTEATAGDYDHALQTCMRWVQTS